MSLTTGGRASGATSTRSNPASSAFALASSIETIPNCSPSPLIRRTGLIRIWSLSRTFCSLMARTSALRSLGHPPGIQPPGASTKKKDPVEPGLNAMTERLSPPSVIQTRRSLRVGGDRKVGGWLPPLPIVSRKIEKPRVRSRLPELRGPHFHPSPPPFRARPTLGPPGPRGKCRLSRSWSA
jgi:hypothetical protein